jgi:Domain of unknown function (DUF6249)
MNFTHLVIPVLGLLAPIVAILAHYLGRAYSERQKHLTVREMVRAGVPVPPELLADLCDADAGPGGPRTTTPLRLLLAAGIHIGLGLGLMAMFVVINPASWLWAIGLVPSCLGLVLAVLWALLRRQPAAA